MISKYNNSPAFGWTPATHKRLFLEANKSVKLDKYSDGFSKAVVLPDYDDFSYLGRKHFYNPSNGRSYLDPKGINNARNSYDMYIGSVKSISNRHNPSNIVDSLGRALHYLQDVTQPMHIIDTNFLRRLADMRVYGHFETNAFEFEEKFIKNAKPVVFEDRYFYDLFNSVIDRVRGITVPTAYNKPSWNIITQNSFNVALGASKRFLEIAKKYIFVL